MPGCSIGCRHFIKFCNIKIRSFSSSIQEKLNCKVPQGPYLVGCEEVIVKPHNFANSNCLLQACGFTEFIVPYFPWNTYRLFNTIVLHIINFELLAFRTWNFCTKESKATNIEISALGWNKRDELSFLFCLAFFRLELSFLVPVFHPTYQYQ